MANTKHRDLQDKLNRCMPIADDVKLGDMLQGMITAYNGLETKYNALLAKLDLDAGVTDTNYAATLASDDAQADVNDR